MGRCGNNMDGKMLPKFVAFFSIVVFVNGKSYT